MKDVLQVFYKLRITALFTMSLTVAVILILFQTLHLWSYDLKIPLNYSGDTLIMLMYIKGLLQDGWPTTITHLSAPFTYPGAAFPMQTSFNWMIIKILSVFTSEPGYLLNGFWLLTFVFSAWSAAYATYQLGLSKTVTFYSGILYAFLPFAFIRNVAHLNLVYYPVPLLCLLAVIIAARGERVRNVKQATLIGLFACVVQGFNYIYYSFFAVLLFGIAAFISYRRIDGLRSVRLPLMATVLVILSTATNLYPSLLSWQKDGMPPEMEYKNVAEAEIYGAKLRKMLLPHSENIIYPLAMIAQNDKKAGFPNENENVSARLGIYGAFGFLLILIALLRWGGGEKEKPQLMATVSALALATFLIITVGGLGAVINTLTLPDIRCYNRFSVFLSFFSIAAAGIWFEGKVVGVHFRWRTAGYLILCGFVILSLYDQLLDGKRLLSLRRTDVCRAKEDRMAVERLEQVFPKGTAVLEMPLTGYPPLYRLSKMESYDHVRPYIWSSGIKWSWPSFSQLHRAWQMKMDSLQGAELVRAAVFSGFDAIWIDRSAYTDGGQEIVSSLSVEKAKKINVGSNRIAVLDIRDMAMDVKADMSDMEFKRKASELIDSVTVEWLHGFYKEEINHENERRHRWSMKNSKLVIKNQSKTRKMIEFRALVNGIPGGRLYIKPVGGSYIDMDLNNWTEELKIQLNIESQDSIVLTFNYNGQQVIAHGDHREMYFALINPKIVELSL